MDRLERRRFLKQIVLGLAALPFLGSFLKITEASGADAIPEVAPNDPTGTALGYVSNGKKADVKKFGAKAQEAHDGKTSCTSCQFFTSLDKDFGNCQLFPGKKVRAKGWCNSFTKK